MSGVIVLRLVAENAVPEFTVHEELVKSVVSVLTTQEMSLSSALNAPTCEPGHLFG